LVLNPAPAARVPATILEQVDNLVPNRAELAALSGKDHLESTKDVVGAALALNGPGAVVVTLGGDGAVAIQGDGWTHVEAPPVEVVDRQGRRRPLLLRRGLQVSRLSGSITKDSSSGRTTFEPCANGRVYAVCERVPPKWSRFLGQPAVAPKTWSKALMRIP
jgi:hypothetical protein